MRTLQAQFFFLQSTFELVICQSMRTHWLDEETDVGGQLRPSTFSIVNTKFRRKKTNSREGLNVVCLFFCCRFWNCILIWPSDGVWLKFIFLNVLAGSLYSCSIRWRCCILFYVYTLLGFCQNDDHTWNVTWVRILTWFRACSHNIWRYFSR